MWQKRFTLSGMIVVAIAAVGMGLIISSRMGLTPIGRTAELWEEGGTNAPVASGVAPDFVKMTKDLKPTVVNVFTTKIIKRPKMAPPQGPFGQKNPFEEFFGPQWYERYFGHPFPLEQKSLGSGFIINKEGYILTNNHVVEGADEIRVKLPDNRDFKAKVVGRDPKTDIALIKIEAKGDLPVARLGDSDKIEIGDWVMAIGNPFGLGNTVTKGIISAKARVIGQGPYDNFLQTDAPINQGNSGGPLFNVREEVIGINTAIMAFPAQGIGFAIPINMAKEILPQLKEKGKVVRGWLGVEIQAVTPELAEALDLKEPKGALIARVMKDSPADKSGIKEKDVITEFNGKKVEGYHDLPAMVALTPVGSEAQVAFLREGKIHTVRVKIAELPEGASAETEQEEEKGGALGLTVQELNPSLAQQFNLKEKEGVIVTEVEPGSPAANAGINPGDIVKEINRKKIAALKDYRAAMEKAPEGKPVLLLLQRGEARIFVAVKP